MSGWNTDGVPTIAIPTGAETASFDTNASAGANPQTGALQLQQLAILASYYASRLDKTMVSGTRYTVSVPVGFPCTITGLAVEVGTTGGSDNWIVELHGPTGILLAYSDLSGTTAGTASTYQQIPFLTAYTITQPGTYYASLISNGNTAKFASMNVPATSGAVTGSSTGVFGTGASITVPTTYTANLGPKVVPYF